jgi:tripartite-type tricarboxylate transporter receptor subunit TctC
LGFLAALAISFSAFALSAFTLSAFAQTYPTRSINLIVSYPPSGGVDAMVRIGGDPLTLSADEYTADVDKEETKWSTLIRKLNLKVE